MHRIKRNLLDLVISELITNKRKGQQMLAFSVLF